MIVLIISIRVTGILFCVQNSKNSVAIVIDFFLFLHIFSNGTSYVHRSRNLTRRVHIFYAMGRQHQLCTVVPFITVWALICFLPEICRIILSVKLLFFWLTEISLASDNWTCEISIFPSFLYFLVNILLHYEFTTQQ